MQKVVGSSPISRLREARSESGFFALEGPPDPRPLGDYCVPVPIRYPNLREIGLTQASSSAARSAMCSPHRTPDCVGDAQRAPTLAARLARPAPRAGVDRDLPPPTGAALSAHQA